MTDNLIEIRGLSFTHVNRVEPTIAHLNLTLSAGEITLISGATGSGKSTLLNCLAGIAPNHTGGTLSGEILYQQTSILQSSVRERSQFLGMILQNVETQIFTDCVSEELAFGLENLNIPCDRIPALITVALQEFGLERQRDWTIAQLSAGQKQRLILACVLAMGQPVLMLDEPFAYLDRSGADLLLNLLQTRAQQGQAILLVEHRLDLVREICGRAFHFDQGRLVKGSITHTSHLKPQSSNLKAQTSLALQTQNLSWGGYSVFPDLAIQTRETLLLKGDNGCGKTTLLKLLSGLLKPTTGTIALFGKNTRSLKVVQIAKTIGFVLQNPNHQLFAETVRQEVLQPGVSVQDADERLAQLDLFDRAHQHPQSLSQGQKRRLALGAVLARQPKICLLDEITVGQDPRSLMLMLNVLQTFTQQGGTLILTSHDSQAVSHLNVKVIELKIG